MVLKSTAPDQAHPAQIIKEYGTAELPINARRRFASHMLMYKPLVLAIGIFLSSCGGAEIRTPMARHHLRHLPQAHLAT
jgi:hypothetical protein